MNYMSQVADLSRAMSTRVNMGVYGDESRGHNAELVHLAPEVPKRPGGGEGVVHGSEGNTDNQEQEISNLGRDRTKSPITLIWMDQL